MLHAVLDASVLLAAAPDLATKSEIAVKKDT